MSQIETQRENIEFLQAEIDRLRAENKRQIDFAKESARRLYAVSTLLGKWENRDLTWTSEKPVIPGWYWWRPNPDEEREQIVEVVDYGESYQHFRVFFIGGQMEQRIDRMGGEWAGPIPKLGEPK